MYIPKNYRDTLDMFSYVQANAPEFSAAPRKVTLDDVMAGLEAGVVGVESRVKNPEARALFGKCRDEIRSTHQLYKDNKTSEARRRIQVARDFFKQAAKLRSGGARTDLIEDDGQPPPPGLDR